MKPINDERDRYHDISTQCSEPELFTESLRICILQEMLSQTTLASMSYPTCSIGPPRPNAMP